MKAFFAALITKKGLLISLAVLVGIAGIVTGIVLAVNSGNNDKTPDNPPASEECEHVAGDWIIEKEPTCLEGGKRIKRCTLCSETIANETLSVADHTPSDWIVDKPADVGVEGKKHIECTVCYALIEEAKIDPIDDSHECTAGDWVEVKETSCKEAGAKVKNCTVCGEELEREEIAKLDHTPSDWITDKEATEAENGHKYKECTVCHEILEEEEIILPHTHVPGEWQTVERATCVSTGKDVQKCTVCKQEINSREIAVNADAHTPLSAAKENEVGATCEAEGSYDLVVRCADCGHKISEEHKTTEKTDHISAAPERENEVAATCSAMGSYDEVIRCSVCDAELSRKTKNIGKIPHDPADAVIENKVEATCTAAGSYDEVVRCSVCETELSKTSKVIVKKSHTPDDPVEENRVEATCKAAGSYETVTYCSVCDALISRVAHSIEKKDHVEGDWVTFKRATCTEYGIEIKNCTECNMELDRRDADIVPHVESDWITDKPADVGVEGERHVECAICGTLIREEKIPALEAPHEHVPGEWSTQKAATCTEKGIEVKNCTTCGEKLDERDIPLADHTEGTPIHENEVDSTCTEKGSYEEVIKCTACGEELSRKPKTIEEKPHTKGEQIIDREPTCALEGAWHKICTVCNETVETGTIDTLDTHTPGTPVQEDIIDSTCEDVGSYNEVTYCSVCRAKLNSVAKEIEKKGHTDSAWKTEKEATCKEEGSKYTECTVCGEETARESIPKLTTHTPGAPVEEEKIDSTCTAEGSYNEVVYCTVCEAELSRNEKIITKKPHTESTDFKIDEGKDSTCTATGTKYTYCTVCESPMNSSTIEKKPHTPKAAVEENRIEATCSTTGSYDSVVYCSVCNGEVSRESKTIDIIPTAHKAGDWEIVDEPTCTDEGTKVKKCTLCSTVVEEGTIPENGHLDKVPVEENRVEPKCTTAGSYEMVTYCQTCNAVTNRTTHTIDAIGHEFGDWSATTAPTTSAAGTLTRTCANDPSHKETKSIAAISTDNGYTKSTILSPTCTAEGTDRYTIKVDNTTLNFNVTVAAKGHTTVKGAEESVHEKCSVCGTVTQDGSKHSYTSSVVTPATCTEKGTTKYTCSCGYSHTKQDIAINASNHTGSSVNGANKDQHTKYSCCGATISSAHSYTDSEAKASTCKTKGDTLHTCGCGYSYVETGVRALDPTNHESGNILNGGTEGVHQKYECCGAKVGSHSYTKSTVTPATCTTGGQDKYTCSCGYSYTENVSATGHNPGDWIITKAATCTETGTRIKTCTICGMQTSSETIANGGHTASAAITDPYAPNYVYTECTQCGIVLSRTFQAPATSGSTNVYENNYASATKPTLAQYESGVLFDWNPSGWTINFAGQEGAANIVQRNSINQTDLKAINDIPQLADTQRFLEVTSSFKLDIFDNTTFVSGYTYYITFTYYAADTTTANCWFGEATASGDSWTATDIYMNLFRHTKNGFYTVTIPYTVMKSTAGNGNVADCLAMYKIGGNLKAYIASIHIEKTADATSGCPKIEQLTASGGYNWAIDDLRIGASSSVVNVSSIADATAKNALVAAGYSKVLHVPAGGGTIQNFSRKTLYKEGYRYKISITYYSMTVGGSGHLIGDIAGTDNNNVFSSWSFNGDGNVVRTTVHTWIQHADEFALLLFNTPELYIAEFKMELYIPTAAELAVNKAPASTITLTQSQIAAGYTFDFSAGNVPALSGGNESIHSNRPLSNYIDIGAIPAGDAAYSDLRDMLSTQNGFKDYAYHSNKTNIFFDFAAGALAAGSYEFEMYVYLAPDASFNGICLLPMNSGGAQQGDPHYFDSVRVYENSNLYRLKLTGDGTMEIGDGVHYFQTFFGDDTENYYISSIYIKKVG